MSNYSSSHNLRQIRGRLLREIAYYEQRLAGLPAPAVTPQQKRSLTCFTVCLRKKLAELAKTETEMRNRK